ncbi:MAG: MerR family transcriptional regulator [Mariniblastus sp.]
MNSNWRISELQTATQFALEYQYEGQTSGRVRSVPDTRAIRYYTTLGILDRAETMIGRTAYYGKRHLLQLVAIKRLQSDGKSLTEVQAELAGATNRKLSRIAKLPTTFWDTLDTNLEKTKRKSKKAKPSADSKLKESPGNATKSDGLTTNRKTSSRTTSTSEQVTATKEQNLPKSNFWAQPPNLDSAETERDHHGITIRNEMRIELPNGIAISVPNHQLTESKTANQKTSNLDNDAVAEITPTIELLITQLEKAGLI